LNTKKLSARNILEGLGKALDHLEKERKTAKGRCRESSSFL